MRKSMKFYLGGAILFALPLFLTSCEGTLDDIFGKWDKPTGGNSSSEDIPEIIAKYEFSVTTLADVNLTEDITSLELTNETGTSLATAELSEGKYTVEKSKLASATTVWVKAIVGAGDDASTYVQKLTVDDLTTLEADKKLKMATLGDLMNSDGTFSAAAEDGKTAVGVIAYLGNDAFTEAIADGGGHGLVLCLKNAASNINWSTGVTAYELGESAKVDNADALKRTTDVSGYTNTMTLLGKDDPATNYPAAYKAYHYGEADGELAAPTGTTGWFLPSAQQWVKMQEGLGELDESVIVWDTWFDSDHTATDNWNTALAKAGTGKYDSMTNATQIRQYWCSSERNVTDAVRMAVDPNASSGAGNKCLRWFYKYKNTGGGPGAEFIVRPILAF